VDAGLEPEGARRVARLEGRDASLDVSEAQKRAGIPHVRFRVDLGDAPSRGPEDAPVTIVMFSDFECPYCEHAIRTVEQLESEYPKQIRFVYKAFPIDRHPNAIIAALLAHSAQERGKFWEFHNLLFSGQRLDPHVLTDYAQRVGLDKETVITEIEDLTHAAALRADLRQARRLDVNSTPVLFINGRNVTGAKPIEAFRMMIEQELALAERETARGVEGSVYEHLTRNGYSEIVYENRRPGLDEDMIYPVPIEGAPQLGPADAEITVVMFEDFQCPFCARGHETIEALRARYGARMRLVYRHFPLPGHPLGALASRGACYAQEQGRFWDYYERVYAIAPNFEIGDLQRIAADVGLDPQGFDDALQSGRYDEQIMKDMELGRRLGVRGTPAYFINGRALSGARPEFDFRMLISEELVRAGKLRDQGVPANQLYEKLTEG
jgi:protein-disulfide isomerase